VLEAVKSSFILIQLTSWRKWWGLLRLRTRAIIKEKNALICQTRDRFSEELAKLGFQTLPSKTNFVLTTHPQADAADLFRYLESRIFLSAISSRRQFLKLFAH